MGWLSSLGGIAGNLFAPGIGGAIGGALGGALEGRGSGGGGGGGSVYVPKAQGQIDQNFLDSIGSSQGALSSMWNTVNPANQQYFNNAFNNPYAGLAQSTANQASGALAGVSSGSQELYNQAMRDYQGVVGGNDRSNRQYQANIGYAGDRTRNLTQLGDQSNANYDDLINYQKGQLPDIMRSQKNLYGGGNQVLNTAFDPQNALYDRTLGQVTEQARGAQYARGIQDTPYGAALENASNQNFNIDWQNQQLARQSQGLAAAQGAYGNAQGMGNSYTQNQSALNTSKNQNYQMLAQAAQDQYLGALNAERAQASQALRDSALQQQVVQGAGSNLVGNIQGVGQIPYGTANQITGNQAQAIGNFQNAYSPYLSGQSNLQGQYLNYLGYGSGAQNNAFNQNAYNQNQRNQAISTIAGPLGDAIKGGWDSWLSSSL